MNTRKMTIRDVDISHKRVIVRVDFNVPLGEKNRIVTDDSRIRAALPTIRYLIENEARVILISHLGRPKGKVVESLRLTVAAQKLSQLLGQQVGVTTDCIGEEVERSVEKLKERDVLMLENLRFYSDEELGNESFAKDLARLGDVFVNDAFGTSHRAHASISGIAKYIPAVAGFLLEKEIDNLGDLLKDTEHPFCAVFGGAKVSDKVGILENMMSKLDCVLIGGGMAATFLKAMGYQTGQSLIDDDGLDTVLDVTRDFENRGTQLLLPVDVKVADIVKKGAAVEVVDIDKIPSDKKIVDIGEKTIKAYQTKLENCKTAFWNGPMGIFEIPEFAGGTRGLALTMSQISAKTIIGGGSTAEAVNEMGLSEKMTFVSTGGGASMSFLSGESLPGVIALLDYKGK
ncbi:phosphoglycerate kinase [Chloroflexota bacterium]